MVEPKSVRLADALRVGEFRALWAAEAVSVAGDQLARVALSLLVYAQTSSAILTGLTYALTFVPSFLGGIFLSGLADRFPRRAVIITTDLLRAGLAAAMAIPGLPLGLLWTLVGLLTFAAAPYKAAQLALLPQVLKGDLFTSGMALRQISNQGAQIAGFLLGGALVAAIAPQGTLLLNAATFVLSVVLVALWVRSRPAATKATTPSGSEPSASAERSASRRLVPVFVLASLVGLWVVPEGLAAPYAGALGGTAFVVGLLMAADPVGSVLGGWLATKMVRAPALHSMFWPAVLAGVPLVVCFARPGLWSSAILWAVSGAASTVFLIRLQAHLVEVVPDNRRGMVMGRISTTLQTSQGLAILGGGAVAELAGPFVAVATAGVLSVAMVVLVALLWGRARPPLGDEQQPDEKTQMSLLTTVTSWVRQSPRHPDSGGDGAGSEHGSSPSMAVGPASPQPPPRGQRVSWALWSKPRPAVAYLLAVCVVSGVASTATLAAQSVVRTDVLMFGVIVASGVAAAEVTRRVERMRRMITDAPHVNLSSVWTLSAAIVLPSGLASVAVVVLYGHLWFRSWRRLPGFHTFRVVFNASNVVLCCQATALVAERIQLRPFSLVDPWTTLGLFAVAIAFYFMLNSLVAATAIALLQSDRSLVRLFGKTAENVLELATLCMAALAVVLLSVGPPLILLVYLPLYALHRSVLLRQFERDAMTDKKTGLFNATSWHTLATKELDRARRSGTTAGLLMITIDNVFRIDDERDQILRDRALVAVAETLCSETRSYDLSGRLAGEEFVVLLPGVADRDVLHIADRIRRAVRLRKVEGMPTLSVSIGVAQYPTTSDQLEELLLATSNALFTAGRDEVRAVEKY
ncbi:MFS transporter [Kibdelosporangium aridum]|uniref:MFS transporter n=1 Tax=Kibdelosporangium aridum TaxID=2030 RepID=UPI0035EE11D5